MTRNNIKAILFDFIGVLLFKKSDYLSDPLVDEIDNLIGNVTNDNIFEKETCDKFHLNKDEFNDILNKVVNKYEPYKPLWNLLSQLRKTYKLAIINNGTGLTLPGFKTKFDINRQFDLFVSSAEERIKKPDPKIYLLTARKLKVEPNNCLFMDDSYKNIEGAAKVGMQTLWWDKNKNEDDTFRMFTSLI